MNLLATLPVAVVIFWLPGACLWRRFGWEGARFGESVLMQVLLSLATGSLALILLGDLGALTAFRLAVLQSVVAVVALIPSQGVTKRANVHPGELLALVFLILAAILDLRPHEQIFGAADTGTYVSAGAQIARSHAFRWSRDFLPSLPPELVELSIRPSPTLIHLFGHENWRFPGFFLESISAGRETPQFFFLFPAWIAVFIDIWGAYAGLFVQSIFAVISTVATFYLFWRVAGFAVASMGTLFFITGVLQVWFSRSPLSELLLQLWILGGLLSLAMFEESRRPLCGWMAGLCLGLGFFSRLDAVLIPPLAAGVLLGAGRWRTPRWWIHFAAPLLLTTAFAALQATTFGSHYFWNTWRMVGGALRPKLGVSPAVLVLLLIAAGIAVAVVYLIAERRRLLSPRVVRGLLAGAVGVAAAYAYWIRPILPPAHPDKLNFVYLASYFTSPLMLAAVVGIGLNLLRRRSVSEALFIAIGLTYAALYLWDDRTSSHQIYMMRRYVFVAVPLACFGAAFCLAAVPWRTLRAAGFVVLLILLVNTARPLYAHSDVRGAFGLTENIAGSIPPNAVIVAENTPVVESLAVPLTYLWDRDVLLIPPVTFFRQEALDVLRRVIQSGRPVLLLAETRAGSIWQEGRDTERFAASLRFLENKWGGFPEHFLWHWVRVSMAPLDEAVLARAALERGRVEREVLQARSFLLPGDEEAQRVASELFGIGHEKPSFTEVLEAGPPERRPIEVFSVGHRAHARLASLREAGIDAELQYLLGYWWLSNYRAGSRVEDVTEQVTAVRAANRDVTAELTDGDLNTAIPLPAVDENRYYRIDAELGDARMLRGFSVLPAVGEEHVPGRLILEVSEDGTQWQQVWRRRQRAPFLVLCGSVPLEDQTGRIRIFLPQPVKARYLRFLGSVSRPERTWSVAEIFVYQAGGDEDYFSCSDGGKGDLAKRGRDPGSHARPTEGALQRRRVALRSVSASDQK